MVEDTTEVVKGGGYCFVDLLRDPPFSQNKNTGIYMAHGKVNSPKHLKNGEFFFETPPKNCTNMLFFLFFLHIPIDLWVEASENLIFRLKVKI